MAPRGGVSFEPAIRSSYSPRESYAALVRQFYRYGSPCGHRAPPSVVDPAAPTRSTGARARRLLVRSDAGSLPRTAPSWSLAPRWSCDVDRVPPSASRRLARDAFRVGPGFPARGSRYQSTKAHDHTRPAKTRDSGLGRALTFSAGGSAAAGSPGQSAGYSRHGCWGLRLVSSRSSFSSQWPAPCPRQPVSNFSVARQVAREGGVASVTRVVRAHVLVVLATVPLVGLLAAAGIQQLASVGPAAVAATAAVAMTAAVSLVLVALPNGCGRWVSSREPPSLPVSSTSPEPQPCSSPTSAASFSSWSLPRSATSSRLESR